MNAASARRNQLVTVAMVFAVFTGFAFVLPFLPLFVRELGVDDGMIEFVFAARQGES